MGALHVVGEGHLDAVAAEDGAPRERDLRARIVAAVVRREVGGDGDRDGKGGVIDVRQRRGRGGERRGGHRQSRRPLGTRAGQDGCTQQDQRLRECCSGTHACLLLQERIATKIIGESGARCTEGGLVRRPCAGRLRWMARRVPVTAGSKCTLCTYANAKANYPIDAYMQQSGVARRRRQISWSQTVRYHTSRRSVF